MNMLRVIILTAGIFILLNEEAISQIPAKGSDYSTLNNLKWGMTYQEARSKIEGKRKILEETTLKLTYEDTLFNTKAKIRLKFIDKDSQIILKAIETSVEKPNKELLQTIEMAMIRRYGDKFESKKESKSKLFITIVMEVKGWQFDREAVALIVASKGDNIYALSIMYSDSSKETK